MAGQDAAAPEAADADGGAVGDFVGPAACLAQHVWQQLQPVGNMCSCIVSTWRFVVSGGGGSVPGRWTATETGCAGATGTATFDASDVRLDFQYPGGAGVYTFVLGAGCSTGPGTVAWTSGACAGATLPSDWTALDGGL